MFFQFWQLKPMGIEIPLFVYFKCFQFALKNTWRNHVQSMADCIRFKVNLNIVKFLAQQTFWFFKVLLHRKTNYKFPNLKSFFGNKKLLNNHCMHISKILKGNVAPPFNNNFLFIVWKIILIVLLTPPNTNLLGCNKFSQPWGECMNRKIVWTITLVIILDYIQM